jgi:hypothetical protein
VPLISKAYLIFEIQGLKPFVDFCGVARSGETAAGIAQHSRLQKSANALQRPSWD